MMLRVGLLCVALFLGGLFINELQAQTTKKKTPPPFQWVNEPRMLPTGVQHGVFSSPSMQQDVGYCVYLPPSYATDTDRRYPVVYYLHGGRPGNENKSVGLAKYFHRYMTSGDAPEMIYVFVNGGPVSHYNMAERKNAMGEDVFVQELIPFIDKTYRTIADRKGRGLEGFSQGGRGTTRIMFKHPDLFSSAAPGGSGYATEKRISEDNGRENPGLVFAAGDNTWDLARKYAETKEPPVRIMVHVGTAGFNYENNLDYMKFLESLEIPFEKIVVDGAPHSAQKIYDERGLELVRFHADNFRRSGALPAE
ncbi:alpha/beta hydrolase-fold protein [Bremerella sp. JC817]|uniref:alpha/beta hydrolase n=1 Tax=Bremerella sp. JC817 TaxID=3231756 RepID=UPI0034575D54